MDPRTVAEHPVYGCNRLEAMLSLEGGRVSSITIQKIFNQAGLGTKYDLWLAPAEKDAKQKIGLTSGQAAFPEKRNPSFGERHAGRVRRTALGRYLLRRQSQGHWQSLPACGGRHLRPYAFGFLHVSKQPEAAVAVSHNDVLAFYGKLDLPVKAVLTDNGRAFFGPEIHPYALYLDLNGMAHRGTKVKTPKTNGFVERLTVTVLDVFFRVKIRETFCETVDVRQADLDAWLVHHDTERPHPGHRNQGRRPIATINLFVRQED